MAQAVRVAQAVPVADPVVPVAHLVQVPVDPVRAHRVPVHPVRAHRVPPVAPVPDTVLLRA